MDPEVVSRGICHKLECLGDFLGYYTSKIDTGSYCYLELFSRFNLVKCRDTGAVIPASFNRAFEANPPFSRYILAGRPDTWSGDIQQPVAKVLVEHHNLMYRDTLRRIFDFVPRSSNIFCIADLPGYRHLRWSTMKKLISYSTNCDGYRMDLLIVLPVEMALLKNMNRQECSSSINRFFGSHAWKDTVSQLKEGTNHRQLRQQLGKIYSTGLIRAGYKYADGFAPERFNRASLYYVIWASDRYNCLDRLEKIWNKPRFLPGEMFHTQ